MKKCYAIKRLYRGKLKVNFLNPFLLLFSLLNSSRQVDSPKTLLSIRISKKLSSENVFSIKAKTF
jgi:hypothetical protein